VIIIALLAAVIGGLGARLPVTTPLGAALLAVVGAAAALSRPAASWFDAIPSVLGAGLAGVTLRWLLRRSARNDSPTQTSRCAMATWRTGLRDHVRYGQHVVSVESPAVHSALSLTECPE
jgi:hypothetical protein